MTIKLLNSEIINMIAAGEVIENPAAIVKELIENSIDAKSTLIEINIEDYGFKKIQIKDNGIGISKEDLLKAPIRHATSKIEKFDDLYNIKTMGFRGEALASIFSISKAKIISKKKDSKKAYEISYEDLSKVKESSNSTGTLVIVEDIFYNTPARKKYLKSGNKEFKEILDIINRFILIHPEIKFILKHNNKLIINKPKFKEQYDNLKYIFGKEIENNLLKINENQDNSGLKITGFISNPSNLTYPIRKNQYLFVNKRFIKSKLIRDAIYEGFGTNLMEGRHPFYVLNIEIDPEIIDVNIHPTKIEIKFENELEIYTYIKNSIQKIFQNQTIFKPFEKTTKPEKEEINLNSYEEINSNENLEYNKKNNFNNSENYNSSNNSNQSKSYFNKETQKELKNIIKENTQEYNYNNYNSDAYINHNKNHHENNEFDHDKSNSISNKNSENNYGPLYERLKEYRIVGQINKTFIIIETPTEMILIDQHVAEEKFYYEKFKEELENKKIKSQILLKSEIIELTNTEYLMFKENKDLLNKLGFQIEEFSGNSIIVRAVPIGIRNELLNPKIIKDILYEISIDNKFKLLENNKIEKLASISCKRSIKAGHELTQSEIKRIIEDLKKLKEPFNCPHGRPILLNWEFKELEKKFKRIV